VNRIWVSLYSPQVGEHSAEMLSPEERRRIGSELPGLHQAYPKLLMSPGIAEAFVTPPRSPEECLFSKMSTNYSADLTTRVEPCPFGSTPDCNQCGCVISSGLHRVQKSAGSGTAKSRTPGPRFDGHWFTAQSAALKVGRSITLEPPSRASAEPGLVQVGLNEGTIDVSEQPSP